ncbi:OmpA family protein [Niveibacterium sp. 24ML]|uniref:OmpA family protein n=1 Tax=Niveibacterium sp. 24ML TaxID=2985512 RepID=UPI0022702105|nr:OmpA family protein [Niveibacterium sp. 24ML]MCX9155739.1 OmpA family protein [Niveibacterium sp. 24ML]
MDEQDDGVNIALWVVGFIIALVLGLVIGLGIYTKNQAMGGAAAAVAAEAPAADEAPAPVGEALVKLYFAVGDAILPEDGAAAVARVEEAAAAKPDALVLISGFHDASGDAHRNAELAKQRALTVRDALLAAGLADTRIKLRKPAVTEGSGDNAEARRVEVHIQ